MTRDEAIDALDNLLGMVEDNHDTDYDEAFKMAINALKNPERKMGKWIGKPIAGYSNVRCSNCNNVYIDNSGKWNYCPNCGAKMNQVVVKNATTTDTDIAKMLVNVEETWITRWEDGR